VCSPHPSPRRRGAVLALGVVVVSALAPAARGQPGATPARGAAAPRRAVPEGLNFANGLFQQRQYALAAEEYERFLRGPVAPAEAAEARYGLANARLFLSQYKEARRQFEEFLRAAPDHPNAPTARFRVGETAYMLGDLPAARAALEAFTAANPGHRHLDTAWPYLGDVCFGVGDLAGARRAYEQALASFPDGRLADRARYGLGRTLAAQKETDAARKVLAELAETGNPAFVDKARYQLGQLQLGAGQFAEAVAAFVALEAAAPKSPLIPEARLARAEALARLDRRDEAEALLRPLIAEAPRSLAAGAAYALGVSQLERGRAAEARATFDDALKRFPGAANAPALLFRSAEAAQKDGQLDEARARFLKMAETYAKDPWADDALLQAAHLALKAGDAAAARALAGSFPGRFPKNPLRADARLVEARAALDAGQPKDAIELLNALLTGDGPGPATAQAGRYYLGLAYRADGQTAKAAEILDALATTPAAPIATDAQFLVGQAHVEAGRFAEAAAAMEKYLAQKPDGEVADHALAYLAIARAELGQADASRQALDRLAARFPKSPALARTRLRLAETALARKQFAAAAELFSPAAQADDPALRPRALSGLGWSRLQDGHPAEAAEAFDALLKDFPADPLAPEAALALGRARQEADQLDAALAAYALVLDRYAEADQAAPAALARARLLAKAGRPAEAAAAFERLLDAAPDHLAAPRDTLLAERGWALLDADQAAEADPLFRRLLEEHPDSPHAADARLILAESAFAEKKYDDVARLLEPLTAPGAKVEPRLAQPALYRLGRTQVERQDWPAAAGTFARLVADFPDGTFRREARFWKAEVAFQAGDAQAAEAEFAAVTGEPGPDAPEAWIQTARLRRLQGLVLLERWDDALAAAEALKDEAAGPAQKAEVDYARGRALQGLARFDEARACFQEVIEARKGGELAARAQLMRGESFFHQKEYREALREFLKVDILYDAPKWQALALLEAGKVYEQLDQWAEAAEIYEKLRSTFPADPVAAEAARRRDAARRHAAGDAPGESP
ncbi:MAG TPA: tetratricopeptide repeat protein, partial [Isosphaeraceae bacterium]